MENKVLINQLKSIKVSPRPDWVSGNREFLLSKISNSCKATPETTRLSFVIKYANIFVPQNFAYRMVGVFVLAGMVLSGGYVTTVSAAAGSIPGDILYGVKKADEGIRLNIARVVDTEKAGELELSYARRRVDEAQKIITTPDTQEHKTEKVKLVIAEVEKHLANAHNSANILSSQGKKKEAIALASHVDAESRIITQALMEKEQGLLSSEQDLATISDVKDAIENTTNAVDKVGLDAVDLIVNNYETSDSGISSDDVKSKVEDRLNDTYNKVLIMFGDIVVPGDVVNSPEVNEITPNSEEIAENPQSPENTVSEPVLNTTEENSVANEQTTIMNNLSDAQKLLETGNLAESMQKIKTADDQFDKIGEITPNTVEKNIEENSKIEDNNGISNLQEQQNNTKESTPVLNENGAIINTLPKN